MLTIPQRGSYLGRAPDFGCKNRHDRPKLAITSSLTPLLTCRIPYQEGSLTSDSAEKYLNVYDEVSKYGNYLHAGSAISYGCGSFGVRLAGDFRAVRGLVSGLPVSVRV